MLFLAPNEQRQSTEGTRLRLQFFTNFHQILHAAQKCGWIDAQPAVSENEGKFRQKHSSMINVTSIKASHLKRPSSE